MEHNHAAGIAWCGQCPAYDGPPLAHAAATETVEYAANMTLRDHFAGLVMAAALSDDILRSRMDDMAQCSEWAYAQADAMLAARAAKREPR